MALISPGVEVTVIDESQYIPAATNSVPLVLIATAQNKVSGTGTGVAAGTLQANANKPYLITSQRDLSATFGVPFFYKTTAGTPINGYELNEYGLLAAYSALGVTNRCYVQRADIDLTELTASLTRPTGAAQDGDFWLDTANTLWGVNQWNQTTAAFTNKVPTVITSASDVTGVLMAPVQTIGSINDYAVVANQVSNRMWFKRGGPSTSTYSATTVYSSDTDLVDMYNTWVQVGSADWQTAWPTVQGTATSPTLNPTDTIVINGTSITVGASVKLCSDAINSASITGVYSGVDNGKLVIYADSTASGGDSSTDVVIQNGTGTALTDLGVAVGGYFAPQFFTGYNYQQPRWRSTDTRPAPTGSVWQKTNNVNLGLNLVLKKYSATLGVWVQQSAPAYDSVDNFIYATDPSGGGINIPVGTTFGRLNADHETPATCTVELFEKVASGPLIVTGGDTTPGPFAAGDSFRIIATQPGTITTSDVVATLTGSTVADFIAAVSAANVPNVSASVNSSGAIVFTHATAGAIQLVDIVNTPVANAGFVLGEDIEFIEPATAGVLLTPFVSSPWFTYDASSSEPNQDPADGRLWYYSATNQADIMIQNNGTWCGYQTVTNDVRGYNLSLTNADGPIFSTTAPTTQTNTAKSPLVYGDLWIDTSDLENYPALYRWEDVNGVSQWVQIVTSDQITENGVLFEDARWAPNGTTDPISDPIPTIASLLVSSYVDLDAPDPSLYPQGMLLWNTRRSGYNVKSFQVDYFNAQSFPDDVLPTVTNAWVNASSNKSDGSPYMGRNAQRAIIVAALKSSLDSSVELREEQRNYNLITTPQYPELIPNMVLLNNDRNNTAFVIGDTPMRLAPETALITDWANGTGAVADRLTANDQYLGTFYPSCQTTDLSGLLVVQPPSHMMLRTILRSDEVAYPWLAPAGTRRGVIDNASAIGYINGTTGEFKTIGVNQSLRDTLYSLNINPITFVPGVGITNFGNKTTTSVSTALNRINVSRLVAFIRGRLQEIGKTFLFEPNDQITRNEMSNAINSLMIDLVNKRGIYDYLVVCDLTNNTPARIDNNELWVDIAIEPVKAVEFIYIPLRIKNTGEIASSVSTVATAG